MSDFSDEYGIKSSDRVGKGVTGLPDTPGLSTGDMQERFDSLGNLAIDKFNAVVNSVGDVIENSPIKLPTMAAIVAYVQLLGGGDMLKLIYDTNDDGVVDNAEKLNGHSEVYFRNQYEITCPTMGYTDESVTIKGVTKTLKAIEISTDKDGNPLNNFTSGMKEDYPLDVSNSSDFGKLYAYEILTGKVKLYFTSAPTAAFNVLIREAV